MIEGPNGPGGVETVSVSVNGIPSTRSSEGPAPEGPSDADLRMEGGVTQGELLRQEQRAGVVPVSQLEGNNRGDSDGLGEEDEVPHARGPEEIGMEDMGPQGNGSATQRGGPGVGMQEIDIEAAVGRRAEKEQADNAATAATAAEKGSEVSPGTPKREAEEDIGGVVEKRLKTDEKTPGGGGDMEVDHASKTDQDTEMGSEEKAQ